MFDIQSTGVDFPLDSFKFRFSDMFTSIFCGNFARVLCVRNVADFAEMSLVTNYFKF